MDYNNDRLQEFIMFVYVQASKEGEEHKALTPDNMVDFLSDFREYEREKDE